MTTTTITKSGVNYTVYSSTAIVNGTQLYSNIGLTTQFTVSGEFLIANGTLNYITVSSSGLVTRMMYAFKTFGGGSTLYTNGPMAVGSILYNDLLYFPSPLKPVTSTCLGTTNWSSLSGLILVETQCSTAEIIRIRTAPFVYFNRFEPTVENTTTARNGKIGYVYDIVAGVGFGGTEPFSVTTGAGANFTGFSAGEVKFDDWRKNNTRNATFADYYSAHESIEYIPTVQYIANPDYYTVTFINGTMNVVFNDIWNDVYDNYVTIEYQVDYYYGSILVPWTTETTFTGLPLRDLQLNIRDEYGSYLMIPVPYVPVAFETSFNRIEEAESASQIDKNNKVSYVYNISGGIPPYSVITYSGTLYDISSGPTLQFDYPRNSIYNSITITDGTNNSVQVLSSVQHVASSSYFTGYTFTNTGVLTITPEYDLNVDILVVPQYRIQDIESGQYLSNWKTTPTFTSLPVNNVYLEVIDNYGSYLKMIIPFIQGDIVTPITELGNISFTNDPMVVIADSEFKTTQNMKYLYTMFDKDGNVLIKTSVYPDIENNYLGIYNMNMIYNNYVTTSCKFNIDNAVVTDNIYEYSYNITDSVSSTGITTVKKYCMKAGTVYGELFNIENYIGEPTSIHRFISKWTGRRLLRTDDYGVINYLNGNFNDVNITKLITHIAFVKYINGESVHTFTNDDTWYHDSTRVNFIQFGIINTNFSNKLLSIPYGTNNYAIALSLGNVVDDETNVIYDNILLDGDTSFYEVHLVTKSGTKFNKVSKSIIIDLNKDEMCLKYEPTKFIWLDMYGSYNTFTFNGMNIKEYSIDRNSVNNDYFNIKNDDSWGYNLGDRGRKTTNIKKVEIHQASSGWLNDSLSKNLMDLYTSSDVYVIINDELYPIIITTNGVEDKTNNNNRLFNHTISYEMAYDINTNE